MDRRKRTGLRKLTAGKALGTLMAIAPLIAAGGHAEVAAAKIFTVANGRSGGPGSLAETVRMANRHRGADRIEFRSGLRGSIPLGRNTNITGSLRISGGRRAPTLKGPRKGGTLNFEPAYSKQPNADIALRLEDLRLDRVSLVVSGGSATEMQVVDSVLSGHDVDADGIAIDGDYGNTEVRVAGTTIQRFDGSGIAVESNYGDTDVERSTLTRNGFGLTTFKTFARVKNSTISGNSPGGGVLAEYYSSVEITKSTISGNSAEAQGRRPATGGGIDAYYEAGASVTNSTVSGNSAEGPGSTGGGIFGSVRVVSSTVTDNSAERGGGIFSAPDCCGTNGVSVENSIVAGNHATSGADCDGNGDSEAPVSKGGNVFGAAGCGISLESDVSTADPRLGPLARNGGPTRTHLPLSGSPAIGRSLPTDLEDDQRGERRGNDPDSGSVEVG